MKPVPNASRDTDIRSRRMHPDTTDVLPGIERCRNRIDNISHTALLTFREHYPDDTITKDAIFDYVYGVLHTPSYREGFANDLSKRYRVSRSLRISTPSRKRGRHLQGYTSVTRRANSTRFPSCLLMTGSRNRTIFG